MVHGTRSRLLKLSIAAFSAAALLVTVPVPASAGRGGHDRHHLHHAQHQGDPHGAHCRACRDRAWLASYERSGARLHRELPYTCGPCGHSFPTSRHFYDHLVRHHHVSVGLFPFPAVHLAWGWVFPR